ncbi:hypothetical protein BC826DRAFT_1079475, partial [Russula brevipes]
MSLLGRPSCRRGCVAKIEGGEPPGEATRGLELGEPPRKDAVASPRGPGPESRAPCEGPASGR